MQNFLNALKLNDSVYSFLQDQLKICLTSYLLQRGYTPVYPGSPTYEKKYIGRQSRFQIDLDLKLSRYITGNFVLDLQFSDIPVVSTLYADFLISSSQILVDLMGIHGSRCDEFQIKFAKEEIQSIAKYLEENLK